ncbi:IS200/IS605 family transposase [Streptomyces microflavus]|uniref:IS200/IS605 family transposase n=1 Tax=Streptomyces microflavus TaxID=1919 RepID=UPI003D9EECF3
MKILSLPAPYVLLRGLPRSDAVAGEGNAHEVMREVCGKFEVELREFNGEADHVHLLIHYPPKIALSKLINSLKGVSSRYLRAEYTDRINRVGLDSVFWSRSYFAGSCGGAPLTMIRQYIEQQKRPL